MDYQFFSGVLSALVWGFSVALFINFAGLGRWLAMRMMWFVVSCGVGVDLILTYQIWGKDGLIPWDQTVLVLAISAVPIATTSVYRNLYEPHQRLMQHAER